mmetsp:Transcript_18969/g.44189  ORF Transcript_18969/g.44189 Transcript_18969/m.44189 type:complete len:694 (-) Transcript_18969:111-2192(-)|eukprot:CAMPEP_0178419248 /NCGR_PEP_ID=MMETSP0689_2-20121128/25511_1 /TAXON_ID=160604 /ORGANISM="Amphidinium massartii, Strain CS-259" /LENGTH=693 /DNA_ID=CAMNT_0020040677 /DNA_START=48 /DNA_END=2129 /DNA_ORIENTATION=+
MKAPAASIVIAAIAYLQLQETAAVTLSLKPAGVPGEGHEASFLSTLFRHESSKAGSGSAFSFSSGRIFGIPSSTLLCFGVGFLGAAVGTAIVYFVLKKLAERKEQQAAEAEQASGAPEGTAAGAAATESAEAAKPQHQITPEECEQLAMKIMQRVAQKVGPQLAKGQAVRSILQTRVESLPNAAKNFVLSELNSICGKLFEAVDAEEAMLLLNWNDTAELALPSPTMMIAGLFSPAMLAIMYYIELVQICLAQVPIAAICMWAIVVDWSSACPGIPILKVWVWFEMIAAAVLIASRMVLVHRIRAGRAELRQNQMEMEQKLTKGVNADTADEDLREIFINYTVLLRKALIVEVDVRESAWHQIAGFGTIFWVLCAIWNYFIVFGWTFVPGVVAFHPAAQGHVGSDFCGAWASVVASRLTSLLSVLFLTLDTIALATFASDRLRHFPFFADNVQQKAAKFDRQYMQGMPLAQTFVRSFVLRASSEVTKAKLASNLYERKQLMKQRTAKEKELQTLNDAIGKLEEVEKLLKEKATGTETEEMEAEAQKIEKGLLDIEGMKEKGHELTQQATEMALALEQTTTADLEKMINRIMEAVNAGMESEAFKEAKAQVEHLAEEGMEKATEFAHTAQEKIKEAHLEEAVGEYVEKAKVEAASAAEVASKYAEEGVKMAKEKAQEATASKPSKPSGSSKKKP